MENGDIKTKCPKCGHREIHLPSEYYHNPTIICMNCLERFRIRGNIIETTPEAVGYGFDVDREEE